MVSQSLDGLSDEKTCFQRLEPGYTNVKTINDVSKLSGARKLVEFLQSVIPIRSQHAKKLISHDCSSNVYNYKYTSSVEVVPICKVLTKSNISLWQFWVDCMTKMLIFSNDIIRLLLWTLFPLLSPTQGWRILEFS